MSSALRSATRSSSGSPPTLAAPSPPHARRRTHPTRPRRAGTPQVRIAARLLTEVASRDFPSAAHLAAYAALAPLPRCPWITIGGEYVARRGNRVLKRALHRAAFAALHSPESRAYYDARIERGCRHNRDCWPWPADAARCCTR